MLKKKGFVLAVLLLMISVIGLTACSSAGNTGTATAVPEETVETVAEPEMITIQHELGETTFEKNPERIVVFDYATLDTLNQMGIEVIGVSKGSVPQYLEQYKDDKYTDIGGLKDPNYEKIYELQPDIILISGRQADFYDELAKIAPTIHFTIDNSDYIGSLSKNLETLGKIFGKEDFVADALFNLEQQIAELNQKVTATGKNALIIMANDGALNAYGKGSRFNIIHNEFGFEAADENIEVANHGQNISFEYIVEKNPHIIFVIDRSAVAGGNTSASQVLDNDLVRMTDAYKNNAIHYLDSHVWYVSSGGFEGTKIMIKEVEAAVE